MKYKVIKEYTSHYYGFPMLIPAGVVLEWFEHGKCYTGDKPVNGFVPAIKKWAVEAWHDYFEQVAS